MYLGGNRRWVPLSCDSTNFECNFPVEKIVRTFLDHVLSLKPMALTILVYIEKCRIVKSSILLTSKRQRTQKPKLLSPL